MVAVFDDVKLKWNGKDYTIKANRVMGAIMRIESVVTLYELQQDAARGTMKLATVASAFGAVLRYAGADVDDAEVYDGLFGDAQVATETIQTALGALLTMMVPPARLQPKTEDTPQGNEEARPKAAGE